MMDQPIGDITQESFGSRLKGSVAAMGGGVLFLLAFPLLFWNESRAVNTERSLKEGMSSVITISADVVAKENEGMLVHLIGEAKTAEILEDKPFGIALNAIKLTRHVEMYQWQEEEKQEERTKSDGSKEKVKRYVYKKEWSTELIQSSRFKHPAEHRNPSNMPYKSDSSVVQSATVGAFGLSGMLINQMDFYQPLPLTQDMIGRVEPVLQRLLMLHNNTFYLGGDPNEARIGDCRISFKVVPVGTVSIVSKQVGNTFEPYWTKVGKNLEIIYSGSHSAENMFNTELKKNTTLTWIMRGVGFSIMTLGLFLFIGPLTVVLSAVPMIGGFINAGIAWAAMLLSFCLTLLTVATAWMVYRPLVSLPLLVLAIASVIGLKFMGKKKVKVAPVTATPETTEAK